MDAEAQTADGTLLRVGDSVELTQDVLGVPRGAQGRVARILSRDDVGVDFGARLSLDCHRLDGELEERHGLWIHPEHMTRVRSGNDPEAMEEEVARFARNLNRKAPKFLTFGTQVFELVATNLKEPHEILLERDQRVVALFRDARNRLARLEQRWEEDKRRLVPLPPVSRSHALKGLRVYKDGPMLHYVLPFHYAPRIMVREQKEYTLSEEDQKTLEQDVLVDFRVPDVPRGISFAVLLWRLDASGRFYHYHSMSDADCRGSFKPEEEMTPSSVFRIRDRFQELLMTINADSLGSKDPLGLPSYWRLIERVKRVEGEGWDDQHLWKRGALVKVLRTIDAFPVDCVGSIGKIVRQPDMPGGKIGVEFLFDFAGGHDAHGNGKFGRCYFFKQDFLELARGGSKRTRSRGVAMRAVRPRTGRIRPNVFTGTYVQVTGRIRRRAAEETELVDMAEAIRQVAENQAAAEVEQPDPETTEATANDTLVATAPDGTWEGT